MSINIQFGVKPVFGANFMLLDKTPASFESKNDIF